MTDLISRAEDWIAGDPDPRTRGELRALIDAGDRKALSSRLDGSLTFGTAGIRGPVGAGPNRMNRAVVIRTTRGLASHLLASHGGAPQRPVVIGFDARHDSRRFAEDTAGVLAAAGVAVRYFPEPTPTPLVAFAAKDLEAASAVVITASHNPAADNGYKVYGANAAQIIPPTDTAIAAAIDDAGQASDISRVEGAFDGSSELVASVPGDLFEHYWEQVHRNRPAPCPSDMTVIYTPLHGVGGEALSRVLDQGGHTGLSMVPEQAQPDGSFPTLTFPNPEEPGALDLAIGQAVQAGAELVLANDPDADRLAVAVPEAGEWRALSGNETAALLADHILTHYSANESPIVVGSVVSSPMIGRIAAKRGAIPEVSLTGFKWIVNAGLALEAEGKGRFVFGYEEALGYTVGTTVRDKDGISAALVVCDLVASLREGGRTALDRLAELWGETGVWASAQHAIVRTGESGQEEIGLAVSRLAEGPPEQVFGRAVTGVRDYRRGAATRPSWLGAQSLIELTLGEHGRVLARPSGTEPKLKIYVDLTTQASDGDLHDLHRELSEVAGETARHLAGWMSL